MAKRQIEPDWYRSVVPAGSRVMISLPWGETQRDPRGMRITLGGVLSDSEMRGRGKGDPTPKLKLGDVVLVLESIQGELTEHGSRSSMYRVRADDGREGWVQAAFCTEVKT